MTAEVRGPTPEWKLVVLNPIILLVYLNIGAATGCFGLALYWLLTGWWYQLLQWQLALLGMGGFLSLTAFAGHAITQRAPVSPRSARRGVANGKSMNDAGGSGEGRVS